MPKQLCIIIKIQKAFLKFIREIPVSLQLFGSDPKIMSEMAKRIEERPFALLDINMGCPVPKIVKNGEGSALMKIRSWCMKLSVLL